MILPPVHANWYPHHTNSQYKPPEPGQLIAYAHVVWRVIEVRRVPEDQWTDEQLHAYNLRSSPEMAWLAVPVVVVVRPAVITSDDPSARKHDKHLRPRRAVVEWWVYRDEHYPICGKCGEPTPCREVLNQRTAEQAMANMTRYEQPGVCPACEQPITTRQKAWTCPDNLEIPGGPPVTFHIGRRECQWAAAQYEDRWLSTDPARAAVVPRVLSRDGFARSCDGNMVAHGDGTYECNSSPGDCPGPLARHQSHRRCDCPPCQQTVPSDLVPAATAIRRNSAGGGTLFDA